MPKSAPWREATRRFTDVHCADPDWAYIETFAAQGITSGCGSGMYCPETVVARDQMAVFLLKIEHGGSYTPPMCTPPGSFLDVPCPAYQFANAIYRAQFEGLTNGCDATHYCPTTAVTETALATFLNKLVLDVQAYHGIQGGSFYTLRDEGNRLVTEFQDSMPARDNVYLGNLLVASYVNKTPTNSTPMWQFHVADHLGTIRASVRGSDGLVSEQHRYWPYGDEVGTPPLAQRLSFAAMEKDTESTHYYDHARTQDFGLGRFVSPDLRSAPSSNPQAWNRYSYALSSPARYVDPDGKQSAEVSFELDAQDLLHHRITLEEYHARINARAAGALIGIGLVFGGAESAVVLAESALVRLALATESSVLIGETMRRIQPVAEELEAGTFSATSRDFAQMMEQNVSWLQSRIDRGQKIFDLGIDAARAAGRSPFYSAEVQLLLKNGYERVFSKLVMIEGVAYRVFEWTKR